MAKRSTGKMTTANEGGAKRLTAGLDVGDRHSYYCVLDEEGRVVEEGRVPTTRDGLRRRFGKSPAMRIALDVGTHSPWASLLLSEFGHEVLVANPRKLRMIYQNRSKQDRLDARSLARVARMDPGLLSAVEHRPEAMAQDLSVLRARDLLVRTRTKGVNHVRGAVKPILSAIEAVSEQIRQLDRRVEELCQKSYPETAVLRQVPGVGPKVALSYVLALQSPDRFRRGRAVGAYLGIIPARRQSGWPSAEARTRRSELWRRWPESWPSFCTVSGEPARSTNHSGNRTREAESRPPHNGRRRRETRETTSRTSSKGRDRR